jgi:hypothetical protein
MNTDGKNEKKQEDESGWIWFVAFDDNEAYRMAAKSLHEIAGYELGQYMECPDGQKRWVVQLKKNLIKQLESIILDTQKLAFKKMIKRTVDDSFEFVPEARSFKPTISESLFNIIKGSSYLRGFYPRKGQPPLRSAAKPKP